MSHVRRGSQRYDLAALRRESGLACEIHQFGQGAFGHAVSLPRADQIAQPFREHRNNVPFSGALSSCPVMQAIFDSFATEIASFRLLRRGPGTAYGLHDDKDKGRDIIRLQIPIVSNDRSFIVVHREGLPLDPLARSVLPFESSEGVDFEFDFERMVAVFGDAFDYYLFAPGFLFWFDTDQIHTAINAGTDERIVLGIDLVVNDWLRGFLTREVSVPVEPVPPLVLPAGRWTWDALRHGLLSHPRVELA